MSKKPETTATVNPVTKKASIKTTNKKVTKQPVEQKVETAKVEKKEKEVAPKFDRKSYVQELIKNFKSDTVDLVADTDMQEGPRATAMDEYKYIHVFKKGTQKNCFQMYVTTNGVQIVVGKNIDSLFTEDGEVTKKPVEKSGKVSYIVYIVTHADTIGVLTRLVDTYKEFTAKAAEVKEEKKAEKKAKKEKTA